MPRLLALRIAALVLAFFTQTASAFIDPPYITPVAPIAGEPVSVNIHTGYCDALFEVLEITREGNAIRILFLGYHSTNSEFCPYPEFTTAEIVGAYPPGDYTLQVDLMYDSIFGYRTDTVAVVPFAVAPRATGSPIPAPANNAFALLLLLVALAGIARWRLSRLATVCVTLASAFTTGAHAQDAVDPPVIELLLTDAPGATTPEEIVAWFQNTRHSAAPPLAALTVGSPQTVQYLMQPRATGDFRAWLDANLASPRAILERYLRVVYPPRTDIAPALAALRAEPQVARANVPPLMKPSSVSLEQFEVEAELPNDGGQYGRTDLRIDEAWQVGGGGGWSLVATIDMGLAEQHPSLRQFSDTGAYLGGNFIRHASLDVGRLGLLAPGPIYWCNTPQDRCVDEGRPLDIPDPDCIGPDLTPVDGVGHGTHVAGLISANGDANPAVRGTCKYCGLAEWKFSYNMCFAGEVVLAPSASAQTPALALAIDTGAQIANMSFGGFGPADFCDTPPDGVQAFCEALQYGRNRDVALIASSGNDRAPINFPASDPRVVSVGGYQPGLLLWDESPGSTVYCPHVLGIPVNGECGSDYTKSYPHPYEGLLPGTQELMASARNVLSTVYPYKTYQDYARCGDNYPEPGPNPGPGPGWGDGIGWCSGTSMSAPQISGAMGVVRSINPLLRVGLPTDPVSIPGLRGIFARTTQQPAWTATFGYGVPDTAAIARTVLGGLAGTRNHLTPLFRLYNSVTDDYADVATPQFAVSLMINQDKAWRVPAALTGPAFAVPGYSTFPHGQGESMPDLPRASIYVMTTEVRPRDDGPALRALHLMDKNYAEDNGNPGDNLTYVDFMLVTSAIDGSDHLELERAHANGYKLRSRQGYIYAPCVHEESCKPAGTQTLWRKFNQSRHDCAVFLEGAEKQAFEADGYTSPCPAGTTQTPAATKLGYVHTSNYVNSPPCSSGAWTLPCMTDDRIFHNGFDVL